MPPTSLAIQLDTVTSGGIPTARLHGIGSDFVMAVWETAPAISAAWPRRWTMRMNGACTDISAFADVGIFPGIGPPWFQGLSLVAEDGPRWIGGLRQKRAAGDGVVSGGCGGIGDRGDGRGQTAFAPFKLKVVEMTFHEHGTY
jgi:hypothetical protein